jgi:Polyketide cyclase / dehydrase and lipid transport
MAAATIDKSIDVDCSHHEAFEKLSHLDTYTQLPSPFVGVEEIQARGANTVRIVEVVEGKREEFDIELIPHPEERIDYRIRGTAPVDGTLTLRELDAQHTTLQLHVAYDPQQVSDVYHLSQPELDQHLQQRLEGMKALAEGQAA